jgi:hypothetical protein
MERETHRIRSITFRLTEDEYDRLAQMLSEYGIGDHRITVSGYIRSRIFSESSRSDLRKIYNEIRRMRCELSATVKQYERAKQKQDDDAENDAYLLLASISDACELKLKQIADYLGGSTDGDNEARTYQ